MTLGAARRPKVLAHGVPVLVGVMLLLVFGAALPGVPGSLLAITVTFTVPFGLTNAGERATVRAFLRARAAPRPRCPHRSAHPVGNPGPEVDACGVGRHASLVTTGLVEALVDRRVSAAQSAAVIAQDVGVLRADLAKG